LDAIEAVEAVPFISFKSNSVGMASRSASWKRMWCQFSLKSEEFLRVEAHVELREHGGRTYGHDTQPRSPQRLCGVDDDRAELLLVMKEQVEIAGLAVFRVESGERRTAGQCPDGSYLG
jgi:hypothetical protein